MPPSTRIPPLLQPIVRVPREDSLLLVTSTLGASANWLLVRFLCDALSPANAADGNDKDNDNNDHRHQPHNVVLVSWMRDYDFWKQEARKSTGLDLDRLRREGRLAFVDGLSGVFCCLGQGGTDNKHGENGRSLTQGTTALRTPAPVRNSRVPTTSVAAAAAAVAAQRTSSSSTTSNTPNGSPIPAQSIPGLYTLSTLDLAHFKSVISTALAQLASSSSSSSPQRAEQPQPQRKTILILDNPDLLPALDPTISPHALSSLLPTLHSLPTISHLITHLQSDTPLLLHNHHQYQQHHHPTTPAQPLQLAHHHLLVKMAHMSRRVVSVRVLDTGAARGVSGVLRVTGERRGDGIRDGDGDDGWEVGGKESKEVLYWVRGDGGVRVFERGVGGEGGG